MRLWDRIASNAISPTGLATASFLFFLLAWTFPPSIYERVIGEPDLMFFDPTLLLFVLLCVGAFVAGVATSEFLTPLSGWSRPRLKTRIPPLLFLLIPLMIGTALTVYSCILLLNNNEYLLEVLLAAEGSMLKNEGALQTEGAHGLASVSLMGISWWAIWRCRQVDLSGWQRAVVWLIVAIATVSMMASALLKFGRGEFIPIVVGIALLILLHKNSQGRLSMAYLRRAVLVFVLFVVFSFVGFSLLRSSSGMERAGEDLMGYTIASYNRSAAILSGRLRYPFSGRGVYLSAFVAFNDSFNKIVPVAHYLDWPDDETLFRSEFSAISKAGLNGFLIWSGTFGYLFSDVGWFTPFVLFVYGFLTATVWRWFQLGRISGIVLYPWFAFCILYWFGTNFLFDTKVVVLASDALLLGLYEGMLVRRSPEGVKS